jgi:hypothetical protein
MAPEPQDGWPLRLPGSDDEETTGREQRLLSCRLGRRMVVFSRGDASHASDFMRALLIEDTVDLGAAITARLRGQGG